MSKAVADRVPLSKDEKLMWYVEDEDGITCGFMGVFDFESLSRNLKEEIRGAASSFLVESNEIKLTFNSYKEAEEIGEKIGKANKNRERSDSRRSSMNMLSEGLYEASDIDDIFEIQEGLCYYTRGLLSKKDKNYHIDHIRPVSDCGGSWPGNLALVLKDINQEKSNLSKSKYLNILKKRNGDEWYEEQKKFMKSIDSKRKKIDKKRKDEVEGKIKCTEKELVERFPEAWIEYDFMGGIELRVDSVEVSFPPGFIRQKKKLYSVEYLSRIVGAILGT